MEKENQPNSGRVDEIAKTEPAKRLMTPEQKEKIIQKRQFYLDRFCKIADWLDQENPRLQQKLQEYARSDFYKLGRDAELQVENVFKDLYDHKMSFFRYFRKSPDSMDLYSDKMDFIAMLNSGRTIGIQLMMLKDQDNPDQDDRLKEKKVEAIKYGIQEPRTFKDARVAVKRRMEAQPGLELPYANFELKIPRGVTWISQEDVEEYPLLSGEEQTKRAAKIAAQFLNNLGLDLNPETRAEIAKQCNFRFNPEDTDKLNGYVKNIVPLVAKATS